MRPDTQAATRRRLARIEGQVRGLSSMVEEGRYCIDIVTQVRAARAALAKVEQAVLADHMESCVETAIRSGDPDEQRRKLAELVDLLARRAG